MWKCERIKGVSTVLILFLGPLRGTASLGEALRVLFTAPMKEEIRNHAAGVCEFGVSS